MLSIRQAKSLRVGDHVSMGNRIYTVSTKPEKSFWRKRFVRVALKSRKPLYITELNLVDFNQIIIIK